MDCHARAPPAPQGSPWRLTLEQLISLEPNVSGSHGVVRNSQQLLQQLSYRRPGVVVPFPAPRPAPAWQMQITRRLELRNALNFQQITGPTDYSALESVLQIAAHLQYMADLFDVDSIWASEREFAEAIGGKRPDINRMAKSRFFSLAVAIIGDLEGKPRVRVPLPRADVLDPSSIFLNRPADISRFGDLFGWFWHCIELYRLRALPAPSRPPPRPQPFTPTTVPLAWDAWAGASPICDALGIQTLTVGTCASCSQPLALAEHALSLELRFPSDIGNVPPVVALNDLLDAWSRQVDPTLLTCPSCPGNSASSSTTRRHISLTSGRIHLSFAYPDPNDGPESSPRRKKDDDDGPPPRVSLPSPLTLTPYCLGTTPLRAELIAVVRHYRYRYHYSPTDGDDDDDDDAAAAEAELAALRAQRARVRALGEDGRDEHRNRHVAFVRKRFEGQDGETFWARFDAAESAAAAGQSPPWRIAASSVEPEDGDEEDAGGMWVRHGRNVFAVYECLVGDGGGGEEAGWVVT